MIRPIAALAFPLAVAMSTNAALAQAADRCGELDYMFEQVLMLRDGGFPRSETEAQLRDFNASAPDNLKWLPLMSDFAYSDATSHLSNTDLRRLLQRECEKASH